MTMTDDTCTVCKRVHGVDGWAPRHEPVYGDNPTGSLPRRQKPEDRRIQTVGTSGVPFDPVLRQALIDKGVLTPEDLRLAQEKINVITGVVQGGPYRSTEGSTDGASRRD